MSDKINCLIDMLTGYNGSLVFNPWRDIDDMDSVNFPYISRIQRLVQHLSVDAKYLLIGEAPGYQGCHFSGVPFTNEKLLIDGIIPRVRCDHRFTNRELPWSEPSATVIWRTLNSLSIAESTVLWNAFAFHPHCAGKVYSNRAPTKEELLGNKHILRTVVEMFPGATMVAVGNVAKRALFDLGYSNFEHVRHPSMGGATKFRDGMESLVLNHESKG